MRKNISIAFIAILFSAHSSISQQANSGSIAPDGVRYSLATDAINSVAANKLKAAFTGREISISELTSRALKSNQNVQLGVFLSQQVSQRPDYHSGSLDLVIYQLPVGSGSRRKIQTRISD